MGNRRGFCVKGLGKFWVDESEVGGKFWANSDKCQVSSGQIVKRVG
jgi:hypothetical protein